MSRRGWFATIRTKRSDHTLKADLLGIEYGRQFADGQRSRLWIGPDHDGDPIDGFAVYAFPASSVDARGVFTIARGTLRDDGTIEMQL